MSEEQNTSILRSFADNALLVAAVKAVIMSRFSMEDSTQLYGLDNESIGEVVRAKLDGRARVEDAFKDISHYRTSQKVAEKVNPAR